MDGVLVDLVRHTYRRILPADKIEEAYTLTDNWDAISTAIEAITGKPFSDADLQAFWAEQGQEFWATVPWSTHGKRLFQLCNNYAPVVLMTTPTHEPSSAAGKMEWINRNMDVQWKRRYAFSPCKHHMAHPGAILVDDGEHNYNNFTREGGECFLWPQPWNATGKDGMTFDQALYHLEEQLKRMASE